MYHQDGELIDLLEVFHARSMRTEILAQLRRLRDEDNVLPGSDPSRRQETIAFYEGMLLTCSALLRNLGDG